MLFKANKISSLFGVVILWALFAFFYIVLKRNRMEVEAGYLVFIGEVGLDVLAVLFAFRLWKKAFGQEKIIFALFTISFLCASITDSSYNIITNILGITNFANSIDSIFDIPFLGFLVAQLLVWTIIFLKTNAASDRSVIIKLRLPVTIAILVMVGIFVLSTRWKIQTTSLVGLYITLDTLLQTIGFVFASLCLIFSINNQIRIISAGYIVLMLGVFMVHFKILERTLAPVSFLETVWILGLLLMVFGFFDMMKNQQCFVEN